MRTVEYRKSVKVAFEAPRFWETGDFVFGGLAWTDRLNECVMYPSEGFGNDNGVLVASYAGKWTRAENPEAFAALSHDARMQICRESIEALHPGKARLMRNGVTVAWGLTPFSEGVAALWPGGLTSVESRPPAYAEMLKPEGPIVFAGEHLSYQPAWQEGAVLSAFEAMKLVAEMAKARATRIAA